MFKKLLLFFVLRFDNACQKYEFNYSNVEKNLLFEVLFLTSQCFTQFKGCTFSSFLRPCEKLRGDFYFIFSYAWFKFLWATLTPHEVTIKWTHKDDSSIEFFLAMINHLLSFHLCQSQYNLQFKTEMQFNRRTCFTWIHFI